MLLILECEGHPCGFKFRPLLKTCVHQAINENSEELMGILLSLILEQIARPNFGKSLKDRPCVSLLSYLNVRKITGEEAHKATTIVVTKIFHQMSLVVEEEV
jgi:hypothetical protein